MKKKLKLPPKENGLYLGDIGMKTGTNIAPDPIAALFTGIRFRANSAKWQAVAAVRSYVRQAYQDQARDLERFTQSRLEEKEAVIAHLQQRITRLSRSIRTINDQHAEALIEATAAELPSVAMSICSEGRAEERAVRRA